MKALVTAAGVHGPFHRITTLADRYLADGTEYPFGVVGAATIEDWIEPNHTPALRKAARAAIRAEKHRRAINGVQIAPSGRWIASDATARARWAAMDLLGLALPADQEEETLENGDFVVTPAFANKVVQAYQVLDRALQINAKTLIAAINASDDPASIDITAGWPVTFFAGT